MKPHLVLLHGWGFQSNIWEYFIPYLEKYFSIIALDFLNEENMTLENRTQYVLENSPNSAIFLGWSLGGLIAMNIAIHYPQRLTHLITIGSTPKFVGDPDWPGTSSTLLTQFSQSLVSNYQTTMKQFILLQFQGSRNNRQMIKLIQQRIFDQPLSSEKILNDGLKILNQTDLRKQLIHIQCPQLYLFGRCDTLVPPSVAEKINNLSNNANVEVLPKLSHAPFLSNPELCAKKIKVFYDPHS